MIPAQPAVGNRDLTLCQLITQVRNFDWTVGAVAEDFLGPTCPSMLGMADTPSLYKDGTFRSIVWVKTKADGKKFEESIPRLPLGKYEALAMAPLVYNPFEPESTETTNPARGAFDQRPSMEDYEVMQFFCVGESSCSDAIARCYLSGKPSMTIPCYGERRYGHARDEDLVMALPAGMMEKALRGLETLYRRGIRYPISYAGAEGDLAQGFPMSYGGLEEIEAMRGNDNRLLLGVTGGIASGKTTVANMLKDLGAPIVDFDLIARQVVAPGQPALKDIVDYFGKQVLNEDGTMDRKKVSDIVFRDFEKRKKLESFIHPRMGEIVNRQINDYAARDPKAIIQVVVPLMIELNLQWRYHKLLLVYLPPEKQIERLAERDGISKEEAANILKSQLAIEEKLGYADFVIHNDHSLDETRKQVGELWETLRKIQEEKVT